MKFLNKLRQIFKIIFVVSKIVPLIHVVDVIPLRVLKKEQKLGLKRT